MIRPAALVLQVFLLAVQGSPRSDFIGIPVVESIGRVAAKQYQTIVIRGKSRSMQPYDGDSSYLWMSAIYKETAPDGGGHDVAQQYGPCGTTLKVSSWNDNTIVVTGFTGDGLYPVAGDLVNFFIWNPQTGRGPAAAVRIVNRGRPLQQPPFMPNANAPKSKLYPPSTFSLTPWPMWPRLA